MLELVKTLGENFKTLSSRLEGLERNVVTKEDVKEIRELNHLIKDSLDAIQRLSESRSAAWGQYTESSKAMLESLSPVLLRLEVILNRWNTLWTSLTTARAICNYVIIIGFSLVGLAVTIVKLWGFISKLPVS